MPVTSDIAEGGQRSPARPAAWERVALALACAIAFYLHVWRVGDFAYHIDNAEIVEAADQLARGLELPLVHLNSASNRAGHLMGALVVYFVAPLRVLVDDLRMVVVPFGLLSLVSLTVLGRAVRSMSGPAAAASTVLLCALSPGLLLDLRSEFFFHLSVLGVSLWLASAWRYVSRRDPWALPWAVTGAVLVLSVHVTGWILVFLLTGFVALLRLPLRRGPVVVAAAAWMALYGPWLVHQLGHGFEDVVAFAAWVGGTAGGSTASSLPYPVLLGNVLATPALFPEAFAKAQGVVLPAAFGLAQRLFLGVELVAFVAACHALRTPSRRLAHGLVLAAVVLPYALLPLPRVGLYPFQFIVGHVPRLVLVGMLVQRVTERGRVPTLLVGAATAALLACQGLLPAALSQRTSAPAELWPTEMLLSQPDGVWQYPFEGLDYVRVRGIEDLRGGVAALLGTDTRALTGRAHGPSFSALLKLPPVFRMPPVTEAPAGPHLLVGRADLDECAGGPGWVRAGGWCLFPYDRPAGAGTFRHDGKPVHLPLQSRDLARDVRLEATLPGTGADPVDDLVVTLVGPNVTGRPVPPELEVRLSVDGRPVPAAATRLRRVLFEERLFRFVLPGTGPHEVVVEVSGVEGSVLVDVFTAPAPGARAAWPEAVPLSAGG